MKNVFFIKLILPTAGGPAYYVLLPQKGITIWPSKAGKELFPEKLLLSD